MNTLKHLACAIVFLSSGAERLLNQFWVSIRRLISGIVSIATAAYRLVVMLLAHLLELTIVISLLCVYALAVTLIVALFYDGVLLPLFSMPEHLSLQSILIIDFSVAIIGIFAATISCPQGKSKILRIMDFIMATIWAAIYEIVVLACYADLSYSHVTLKLQPAAPIFFGWTPLFFLSAYSLILLVRWAHRKSPECAVR